MIFYAVSDKGKTATAIMDVSKSIADRVASELKEIVDSLWFIDIDSVNEYEQQLELHNIHNQRDTYELVKQYGREYTETDKKDSEPDEEQGSDPLETLTTGQGTAEDGDFDVSDEALDTIPIL